MSGLGLTVRARLAAPHVVTAIRAGLGMSLILMAAQRQVETAAIIWLFGLGTDVLDGLLARRLGVCSQFGSLFDFFADYVYHVLTPASMSLSLLENGAEPLHLVLLSLPAPFAAMRYARKAGLSDTEYPGIPASRGLATIVYGFYVVALVFLQRETVLERGTLTWLLLAGTPVLSVLMMARTRYPKLGVYPWILFPILAGLAIMPFFQTAILACVMLGIVVGYVALSPLLIEQHPQHSGASRDQAPHALAPAENRNCDTLAPAAGPRRRS